MEDTRLCRSHDVRRIGEGRGLCGGPGKRVDGGCFLDDLRTFGINADQWTTAAQPGRGGMAQNDRTRGGTFHGEMIAVERVKAGLRHTVVVCPNVRGRRTKGEDSPKQAGLCWFARPC